MVYKCLNCNHKFTLPLDYEGDCPNCNDGCLIPSCEDVFSGGVKNDLPRGII